MKDPKDIIILGIETSCDETAAAVVRGGREVLSNIISSQIDVHTLYGGVVPEIASRLHLENINGIVKLALKEAGLGFADIDAIAVTKGPGLVGALLIGVSEAKALAFALGKPLVGVHHIKGHVAANYLTHRDLEPPFVCLIVSGGHTTLCEVEDYRSMRVIGQSVDDSAGEAFDKVARAVGLGYPGGPKIDRAAKEGDPHAVEFPRPEVKDRPYDFTFSGLKSAVLNYINKAHMTGQEICVPDLAASFQRDVVESLTGRAVGYAREHGLDKLVLAGGVSANSALRKEMAEQCAKYGIRCCYPEPVFCTDNAAMIAAQGYYDYLAGDLAGTDLNANPGLRF